MYHGSPLHGQAFQQQKGKLDSSDMATLSRRIPKGKKQQSYQQIIYLIHKPNRLVYGFSDSYDIYSMSDDATKVSIALFKDKNKSLQKYFSYKVDRRKL